MGFDLSSGGHATTLVVAKNQPKLGNKLEYFFADSFNNNFSSPSKKIIELFENQERLKNMLLRRAYRGLMQGKDENLTKALEAYDETKAKTYFNTATKNWRDTVQAFELDKLELYKIYGKQADQDIEEAHKQLNL